MIFVEKRDRGLAAFVLCLFILAPMGMSFAISNINGWSTDTQVAYNITDVQEGSGYYVNVAMKNATDWYFETQTEIYDNDTKDIIVASLDFDTVTSATNAYISSDYNTTFLADESLAKVVVSWTYTGTGNITKMYFKNVLPSPVTTIHDWGSSIAYSSSSSLTWTLEAFEAQKIRAYTKIALYLIFDDATDLPGDTDTLLLNVQFYVSTSLLTQDQLLQGLGAGIGIAFLVCAAFISPYWNPQTRPNPLKNRRKK